MSDLMLTAVLSMPYDMAMADDLSRRQFYDRAQQALEVIERLTAERDELRAALVATMEIVQEDRAGFALANTWPDGSMEAGDDAILRRYDAVIAQADAALGVER